MLVSDWDQYQYLVYQYVPEDSPLFRLWAYCMLLHRKCDSVFPGPRLFPSRKLPKLQCHTCIPPQWQDYTSHVPDAAWSTPGLVHTLLRFHQLPPYLLSNHRSLHGAALEVAWFAGTLLFKSLLLESKHVTKINNT
jgi:hypothetical protein